ncbi:hypothetical protein QVD17_12911 [Tagetes erecta]|uniref:Protein kinase domain-containing protein n=1 Tax=Tagetes erecta TaxID=13708 RepID=A0AAD8P1U9_TARER|nr:hypothetical protein QVD17_12911 [Tagetes erecta]
MYAPPSMASHRPYDMTTVYPAPSMASHRFYKMSMIFRSFEKPPSIGDRDPRAISTKVELADIMSRSLNEYAYLHVPLEDIKSATNNFADENILGEGGAGKLYKAKLTSSGQVIDIVARRLEGQASEFELWREVSMLSSPQHSNLALVIGYCDENGEKIIIYDHSGVHGCLDKHLSDHATLTWSQRMKICLGVAEALQHIHYDDIHCGISTSTVLIDKEGEAKVFGFGLSTSYPGNWVHRLLLSHYNDTSKEMETVDRDLVRLTPKYDVYSFGLLLYEVLCGRKPVSTENGVVKEKLHEMIHADLTEQMSTQSLISLSTLSRLASNCLNQEPMMRPTMDMIVGELKEILKQPEDSEHSKLVDEATPSKSLTVIIVF